MFSSDVFKKCLFFLSLFLLTACWFFLFREYSFFQYISTPHYALDKVPGYFFSDKMQLTLRIFFLMSFLYLISYVILIRIKNISRLIIFSVAGILLFVSFIAVFIYPIGALDIFNYIIELKLFYFYKQNPFVSTFAPFISDSFAKYAFFLNMHTFYGPVWFLFTGIPVLITGLTNIENVLLGLKVVNLILIIATAFLLYLINKDTKKGFLTIFLFLANPLLIFEGIVNAHNDILMTFFLVAAFFALKKRSNFTLMLLMLSVLVKFFTIVLAPVFIIYILKENWKLKLIFKNILFSIITLFIILVPFWDNGNMIQGLVIGAKESQNLHHVSIPSLTIQYLQHNKINTIKTQDIKNLSYILFILMTFLLYIRVWFKKNYEQTMIEIYLLFCLIISLLYSWYLLPVFAIISFKQNKSSLFFMFIITLLSLIKYPYAVWAWFDSGFRIYNIHFFQSIFLTIPITIYLCYSIFFQKENT